MEGVRRNPFRHPLAIALYVLAGLVVVAGIALTLLFPPAKLRQLLSDAVARSVAREVQFDDVRLGLWPPVRLTVRGLAVGEPGGLQTGRAISASAVHLDLSPWPLLTRRVLVERLVLDRPALHLALYADGTTNFDKMMKEQAGEATTEKPSTRDAMDLAVKQLRIQGAQVLVDDYKSSKRISFGLETQTSLHSRQGGKRIDTRGETTISNLAFGPLSASRRAELDTSLARLDWKIQHDGAYDAPTARLALEKLALSFGGTQLALKGVVDRLGARPRLDLRAKASRVDLAEILSFVSHADAKALAGISGSGTLDLDLEIQGTPADAPAGGAPTALFTAVKVLGTMKVSNAAFRFAQAPAGVEGVDLTANFEGDAIRIPKITGRAAGQPVTASLEVERFADPVARFTVNGNFDLAAVGPLVAPKDTRLGGRAAVALAGSGPVVDPGSVALQGRVQLHGVTVESPDLPKKIERVDGAITFSESRATVSGLKARAGMSSFTLDATVARPMAMTAKVGSVAPADVRFTLRSPSLNLDELYPATPGSVETSNIRGTGRVEIARYRQDKLEASNLRADLELDPGIVTVPSFSLAAYGGSVAGSARFDTRHPEKPAYTVKGRVGSVEADRILSALTPAKGVLQGLLSTTFDVSGVGTSPDDLKRTLTAVGQAAITEGQLGPTPVLEQIASLVKIPKLAQLKIKDGDIPFRVEQGRVVTSDVVLHGSSGDWRASGAIGFDGGLDYAVSTTLPAEVASQLGGAAAVAAGALTDEKGRILVDLKVGGTARKPRISWDSKAMQERLAGKASETLAAQKEKIGRQLEEAVKGAVKDSAGIPKISKSTGDSIKKNVRDLFKGLFGKAPKDTGTKGPPSAAAPDTGNR